MVPWLLAPQGVDSPRPRASSASPRTRSSRTSSCSSSAARPGTARRADRGPVGGRPGLPRQRRRHRPAAAPRRRRGPHPDRSGCAPWPRSPGWGSATPSTAPWPSSRRPPAAPSAAGARIQVDLDDGVEAEPLADARKAPSRGSRRVHLRYLVAEPRRGDRARRRPDARGQPRRALVPRGLVPPGRGRPAVPARPDRVDSTCSTSTARRRRTPARATSTPASSRPARPTCWSRSRLEPGAAWVSDYYPIERRRVARRAAAAGDAAHGRHRLAAPAAVRGSAVQATVLEPAALAAEVARRRAGGPAAYAAPDLTSLHGG